MKEFCPLRAFYKYTPVWCIFQPSRKLNHSLPNLANTMIIMCSCISHEYSCAKLYFFVILPLCLCKSTNFAGFVCKFRTKLVFIIFSFFFFLPFCMLHYTYTRNCAAVSGVTYCKPAFVAKYQFQAQVHIAYANIYRPLRVNAV